MDEPLDTLQLADRLTGAGVPDGQAKMHAAVLADALRVQQLALERHMVTSEQLAAALTPIHIELARHGAALDALANRVDAVEQRLVATEARLLDKIGECNAKIDATEARLLAKITETGESVLARSRSQAFEVAITVGLLQGSLIGALLVLLLK